MIRIKEQILTTIIFKKQFLELGSLIAVILVTIYFSVTALYGEYGLFTLFKKQIEREQLLYINSKLELELEDWQNLTKRISTNFLDLDLLEEQARRVLRLARPDEAIFFH